MQQIIDRFSLTLNKNISYIFGHLIFDSISFLKQWLRRSHYHSAILIVIDDQGNSFLEPSWPRHDGMLKWSLHLFDHFHTVVRSSFRVEWPTYSMWYRNSPVTTTRNSVCSMVQCNILLSSVKRRLTFWILVEGASERSEFPASWFIKRLLRKKLKWVRQKQIKREGYSDLSNTFSCKIGKTVQRAENLVRNKCWPAAYDTLLPEGIERATSNYILA